MVSAPKTERGSLSKGLVGCKRGGNLSKNLNQILTGYSSEIEKTVTFRTCLRTDSLGGFVRLVSNEP